MVVAVAYAALFFVGLIDNLRGASYPLLLERFAVTPTLGASLFWLASLGSIIMSYNCSKFKKRWGQKAILQAFLFGLAVAGFGFALIIHLSLPFTWLWPFIFLLGLSMGGIGVSINVMATEYSSAEHRRRVLSGLHAMYGVASMVSPLLLNQVLAFEMDWAYAYFFASLAPLAACLFLLKISFTSSLEDQNQSSVLPTSLVRPLLWICLAYSTYVATEIYVSSRLVQILTGIFDIHITEANQQLAQFFALLLLGRLSFGLIKFPGGPLFWLSMSLIGTMVLLILGASGFPALLSWTGLPLSWFFPCGMDWLKEKFGIYAGIGMGKILASISIALVLMHALVGLMSDLWGPTTVLQLFPILPIISFFCLLLFNKNLESIKNGVMV